MIDTREKKVGKFIRGLSNVEEQLASVLRSFRKILKYQHSMDPQRRPSGSALAPKSSTLVKFTMDNWKGHVDRRNVQRYKCCD
ncbi:hypothetical protein FRX31_030468 [Thalictrum thalictroides]|uniref:Uncharacterized protein n=1 Tax=Thalictrum thalictroides TaxID=46969 RepID=A0A7J6V6Y0_THATH|nr:hypothetical protein FRX31_030468 [Thalictrum thalictroides]